MENFLILFQLESEEHNWGWHQKPHYRLALSPWTIYKSQRLEHKYVTMLSNPTRIVITSLDRSFPFSDYAMLQVTGTRT
jgi:hypothetical protein